MNYGVNKCIWTALGDISANFIQGTLVIFVIGSFFSDNPNFLNIFKWVGIIYLVSIPIGIIIYNKQDKKISEKISLFDHYLAGDWDLAGDCDFC